MTQQETIEIIQSIVKKQFDTSSNMINDALDDSDIVDNYYGEVRCLIRYFMCVAVQQKEERDALYRQLTQPPCQNTV